MKFEAFFAILGVALTGLAVSGPALADVKYTETMTLSGKSALAGAPMRTTTYLKAGLQRTDQAMTMGPFSMKMISVSSCPAKRSMRFDPALKLYTSSPLFDEIKKPDDATTPAAAAAPPAPKLDKKNGKITISADIKFQGTETIADRKARHYLIDQKITPEGCAGKDPTNFKMEIWVADYDMPSFACRSPWMENATPPGRGRPVDGGCSITTEFKGDQTALAQAYKGLVVKRKMMMGETVMTFELTELSEARLDDTLFAMGTDWKLVVDAEFDKARSSAMMKGMMSGAGAPPAEDDGDKPTNKPAIKQPPATPPAGGGMGDVTVEDKPAGDDADKPKDGDQPAEEMKPKKPKFKLKLPF